MRRVFGALVTLVLLAEGATGRQPKESEEVPSTSTSSSTTAPPPPASYEPEGGPATDDKVSIPITDTDDYGAAPKFAEGANVEPDGVEIRITGDEKEVHINCTVEGNPRPRVEWTKDDERIYPKREMCFDYSCQEIKLFPMLSDVTGVYRCVARNKFGSVEGSVVITNDGSSGAAGNIVALVSIPLLIITIMIGTTWSTYKSQKVSANEPEPFHYDISWEFGRRSITLENTLGYGYFARVDKGKIYRPLTKEPPIIIAVKMSNGTDASQYFYALQSELKILLHLGKHLNIVNLVGASSSPFKGEKLWLLLEYCCHGQLRNFILKYRQEFVNQIDPKTGIFKPTEVNFPLPLPPPEFSSERLQAVSTVCSSLSTPVDEDSNMKASSRHSEKDRKDKRRKKYTLFEGVPRKTSPFTTTTLVCWAWQVAQGMEFLARKKVVYRDLALKNLLLAYGNVVKICSFDNAHRINEEPVVMKKKKNPVQWWSIESLCDNIFTTKSDVWSFGCVLYELFALGRTPFFYVKGEKELMKLLMDGCRLEKPPYADRQIYGIMGDCWQDDPKHRPQFKGLCSQLSSLLPPYVLQYYAMMGKPHEEYNKKNFGEEDDHPSPPASPDHETPNGSCLLDLETPNGNLGDRPDHDCGNISVDSEHEGPDLCMKRPLLATNSSSSVEGKKEEQSIFSPRPDRGVDRFFFDGTTLKVDIETCPDDCNAGSPDISAKIQE